MERTINLNFEVKPVSVIKYLRKNYPTEEWKAIKTGFGSYMYKNNKGEHAYWVSSLAPRYDGDDDTFVSQFYIYRKGKPERLWFDA